MHSRHKCVVCQTEYEPFMSFGRMPIANGFLSPEEFPTAYFFGLKVGFCHNCAVVQLAELVVANTKILLKTDAIVMFEDPYLGYFCHKFEEEKFDCYAVENDRENLYFLKTLKRAEDRNFRIVPKSILEYQDIKNLFFDVVLALNIFHHFLKKRDTYYKFINSLQNLRLKEMFFEPHLPNDPQMESAYKNYSNEEFVKFITQNSSLKDAQFIGEAEDGRKIYKLY